MEETIKLILLTLGAGFTFFSITRFQFSKNTLIILSISIVIIISEWFSFRNDLGNSFTRYFLVFFSIGVLSLTIGYKFPEKIIPSLNRLSLFSSILIVWTMIMAYGKFDYDFWGFGLILLPITAFIVSVCILYQNPGRKMKIGLYLWYFFLQLVFFVYQSSIYFSASLSNNVRLFDFFVFGSMLPFTVAYFGLLITMFDHDEPQSVSEFKNNWDHVNDMYEEKFQSEKQPLYLFPVVLIIQIGLPLLNFHYAFVPNSSIISLSFFLLMLSGLSHSRKISAPPATFIRRVV